MNKEYFEYKKILLGLLPFWTPLIPPMGISCIKSFLREHGYAVKTFDANIEEKFREIYEQYFVNLREYVPENKRGNFYNIGHDLLQNHMMAHINYENEMEYIELVKIMVFKNYFCKVDDQNIRELNKIIDRFYNELGKYILDLLEKEKPEVLGLSVYRGTLPASLYVLKLTRQNFPHIKTVMGGGIFSQELDFASENLKYLLGKTPYSDYIDKILIGEGEILFLKYLQGELNQSQRIYSLKDIDNQVLDLTSLDLPDFSDFECHHYPYIPAYTSRSCPFQCSFCAETIYWGKYRKKNSRQVVEEMRKLSGKHNHRLFLMCDSLLNPIITDLARQLANLDVSLYWDGYLRVDQQACDVEKAFLWRRGGFYRARLGVESGSPKVLGLMEKKITLDQIKKVISNLADAGIKTTTYWIIGHPGETEEDFQQTMDLVEKLKDEIYEAECNPFRYFMTGQVNSAAWAKTNKRIPLYPKNARNLLIVQTWDLDAEPLREEVNERIIRFVEHCSSLGIPNPYSLHDIYKADERWEKLHKNAVPSLLKLSEGSVSIDETKYVKQLLVLQNKFHDEEDFCL